MTCNFLEPSAAQTVSASIPKGQPVIDILQPITAKLQTYDQVMARFNYFVNSNATSQEPSFAIRAAIPVPVEFMAFNFYAFSDTRGLIPTYATRGNQYLGQETIDFTLKFSNLTEEFYAGDRLYIEVGYHRPITSYSAQYDRIFVDFTDRVPPPYVDNSTLIMAITIPIGSVILLVIASIALFIYCYRSHKQEHEREKNE